MIQLDPRLKNQIQEQAYSINCGSEEYLNYVIQTHLANDSQKQILLEDYKGFYKFLEDFFHIIENLDFIEPGLIRYTETLGFKPELENVFEELAFMIAHDSSLLLHLYATYKKKLSN